MTVTSRLDLTPMVFVRRRGGRAGNTEIRVRIVNAEKELILAMIHFRITPTNALND
jgi:hypothetical protein